MSDKHQTAELGTIIHATMRPQDLLPAFVNELVSLGGSLEGTEIPEAALNDEAHEYWEEDFWLDLEVIEDRLQEHAPDGAYFGAHPGDGSDFGFWAIED